MAKKNLFVVTFLVLVIGFLFSLKEALAIPAFSRQTNLACNSCHFQHFPSLNDFGRAFKASGYTQIGDQGMIEGEVLSLPIFLNASLITKVKYQKRNGTGQTGIASELNKGQLQFPDEAGLHIGGRAGKHLGFLLEARLKDGESLFSSYKMPAAFDLEGVRWNIVPFSTDTNGASYGFELLNTGALKTSSVLEHRPQTSAQQYIGTDTIATGLAIGASQPYWFANYTLWSPAKGNVATGPYLNYMRATVTPTIADWDFGGGIQWWSGTSKTGSQDAPARQSANAWALDMQAQGNFDGYPIGVYVAYANAKRSSEVPNLFNPSKNKNKTAWSVLGEVGVIPGRLTLAIGYRVGKDGDQDGDGKSSDNALTLGAVYNVAQNVTLQFNHSWFMGNSGPQADEGSRLTTASLFTAF